MVKKILVFGATGPLGIYICQEALKHEHQLTVYARNPQKLPTDVLGHANIKIIKGEITDVNLINSAIAGQDVIISALGPVLGLQAFSLPTETYSDAYRLIFTAMRQNNVKRIFIMGTPSIQDSDDKYPILATVAIFLTSTIMRPFYKLVVAIGEFLDEKENEDMEWTMYRVGQLKDQEGELNAGYVGDDGWVFENYRPGIAKWLVEQAEKEIPEWVREKPSLWSKPMAAGS